VKEIILEKKKCRKKLFKIPAAIEGPYLKRNTLGL
jgi:hypothetical protein